MVWLAQFIVSQLKCALNLHLIFIKSAYQAINMVLFYALVIKCCLLNLSQIAPLEGAVPAWLFEKFWCQISTNLMHYLHHCRKFMQIRCQKGAGTKMYKCLVDIW